MCIDWVRTLDVYNGRIYPYDTYAKSKYVCIYLLISYGLTS